MFAYVLGFAAHPCAHNQGINALTPGQMAEFYARPVHRPRTKSAAHLLSIEGGKRDLFERYVAASTPTHPLFKCVSALFVDPTGQTGACAFIARGAPSKDRGTETERRTQKQAASQRAVSVFPPHAGAWLKHTCRRPTLHTREQSTTKRPPRRRPC